MCFLILCQAHGACVVVTLGGGRRPGGGLRAAVWQGRARSGVGLGSWRQVNAY